MKLYACLLCLFVFYKLSAQQTTKTENIFIITTDGLRWQEVFTGADSSLLNNSAFTKDIQLANLQYWQSNEVERRKILMPFLWNVIGRQGQLYGNRYYENNVKMANPYKISYPGYNELLTGTTDLFLFSNKKINNKNTNLLTYLNSLPAYKGQVAAFSSWNVLPYVLNEKKYEVPVNGGYENINTDTLTQAEAYLNTLQEKVILQKEATRYDDLTLIAAKEYIQTKKPKLLFVSMGETDEYAHHSRYDLYLQAASHFDKALADLWYYVQTHEPYKNKTTFIITTDHGRGNNTTTWSSHGPLIKGSAHTWMAIIGPDTSPLGEVQQPGNIYGRQLAAAVVSLLGESATAPQSMAKKGFSINIIDR